MVASDPSGIRPGVMGFIKPRTFWIGFMSEPVCGSAKAIALTLYDTWVLFSSYGLP